MDGFPSSASNPCVSGACGAGHGGAGATGGTTANAGGMSAGTGGASAAPPMSGSVATAGSTAASMGGSGGGGAGIMANGGAGGGMPLSGAGGRAGSTASDGDVPANEACQPVATWAPAWAAFEQEVLELVNQNRAMGWNCDTEGQFGAAPPLAMNAFLRCSARLHSKDMADREYFSHDNPDGDGPPERIDAAGYMAGDWGENIAMGQETPAEVVSTWMESDGHCSNIMSPDFTEIGVGFVQGASRGDLYWTQNFGAPCSGRRCM